MTYADILAKYGNRPVFEITLKNGSRVDIFMDSGFTWPGGAVDLTHATVRSNLTEILKEITGEIPHGQVVGPPDEPAPPVSEGSETVQ